MSLFKILLSLNHLNYSITGYDLKLDFPWLVVTMESLGTLEKVDGWTASQIQNSTSIRTPRKTEDQPNLSLLLQCPSSNMKSILRYGF